MSQLRTRGKILAAGIATLLGLGVLSVGTVAFAQTTDNDHGGSNSSQQWSGPSHNWNTGGNGGGSHNWHHQSWNQGQSGQGMDFYTYLLLLMMLQSNNNNGNNAGANLVPPMPGM